MAERKLEIVFLGNAKPAQEAMQQLAGSAGGLEAKVSGLEGAFSKVASVAGGFLLGNAITKGPAALMGLSDTARDLELQMKKATVVFGDQLPIVQRWAAGNAAAMGLTRSQALNLAAGLQDLLVPMGMTREEATALSTKTIGLAGALAEWSGGQKSAAEVADILTKAYLGETDGLKALGISISAAEVDARLLEKGQKDLTGQALQQAKALAIQELIFEKSTDAQKAFAEGAGSAARKQAEMRARTEEAREALALALGPAIAAVMTLLATGLVPVLQVVGTAIEGLSAGINFLVANGEYVLPVIAGIAGAILTALVPAVLAAIPALYAKAAAWLAVAAASLAANAPLILIAAAVGLVIAGVILLVRHWDEIVARFPVLGPIAEGVRGALQGFAGWITGTFVPAVEGIATTVVRVVGDAVAFVREHWDEIRAVIEPALQALVVIVESIWREIENVFRTALGVISGIVDVFVGVFTGDWDRAWGGVKRIVTSVWDGIVEHIRTVIGLIAGLAPLILEAGSALGGALLDGLREALSSTAGFAGDVAEAVLSAVKNVINRFVIDPINRALEFTIPGPGPLPDIHINPPDIPRLARGGIVTRPTLALIGEDGPEAVVPLGRGRGALGLTVVQHFYGDLYARDEREARLAAGDVAHGLLGRLRAAGVA
jgi:hypothetical protein